MCAGCIAPPYCDVCVQHKAAAAAAAFGLQCAAKVVGRRQAAATAAAIALQAAGRELCKLYKSMHILYSAGSSPGGSLRPARSRKAGRATPPPGGP